MNQTSLSSSSSRPELLSTAQALDLLLAAVRPVTEVETLATLQAHRRVLAASIISPLDVPPMAISAMDGYAVRCADWAAINPQAAGQ